MREVTNVLAPCGLNCVKCLAYENGEIKKHSVELQKLLGNFDSYAEKFSSFDKSFKDYPQFKNFLNKLIKE